MSGSTFYGCKLDVRPSDQGLNSSSNDEAPSESSGAFSLRMMGISPETNPSISPAHSPTRETFNIAPNNIGVHRSLTNPSRDHKSAAALASRRPYSVNFDGAGRMDWEDFTRQPTLGIPGSSRAAARYTPTEQRSSSLSRSQSLKEPMNATPKFGDVSASSANAASNHTLSSGQHLRQTIPTETPEVPAQKNLQAARDESARRLFSTLR